MPFKNLRGELKIPADCVAPDATARTLSGTNHCNRYEAQLEALLLRKLSSIRMESFEVHTMRIETFGDCRAWNFSDRQTEARIFTHAHLVSLSYTHKLGQTNRSKAHIIRLINQDVPKGWIDTQTVASTCSKALTAADKPTTGMWNRHRPK